LPIILAAEKALLGKFHNLIVWILHRILYPPAKVKTEENMLMLSALMITLYGWESTPTFVIWQQGGQRATLNALSNRGLVRFIRSTGAVRLRAAF
jgi:hypothetical protein